MSALEWLPRKQWTTGFSRDGWSIDITITKSPFGDGTWTWWVDASGFNMGHEEYSTQPEARSLTEAKRRAVAQGEALLERLQKARGAA